MARTRAMVALAGATAATCAGILGSLVWRPRPVLLWNSSRSSPVGLYAVTAPGRLKVGDTAIAWPPPAPRRLAAERHYLPLEVPLVKKVAAIAGSRVCAQGTRIEIDGRLAAIRHRSDRLGRALPTWSGCVRLRQGQAFLLSKGVAEAFDGRYFGVTQPGELVGRARLLWPR